MEKIFLTAEEKQLIEKHLNGKYNPFFATEVEQAMFNNLIDKAEAYEEAVNGIDERMEEPNCDLLAWFYKKYNEQEEKKNMEKIILTEKECELIQKHIAGNGRPFFETEVEKVMYNNLIERAFAYERVFDGHEERMEEPNCDLLSWYYKKFNQQEGNV